MSIKQVKAWVREKVELEPVSRDRECAPRSPVQLSQESEHGWAHGLWFDQQHELHVGNRWAAG